MMPAWADPEKIPFALASVDLEKSLTASFQKDEQWRGADGACSVALNKTTSLWLFGDSFVRKFKKSEVVPAPPGACTRFMIIPNDDVVFINNTIATFDMQKRVPKFFWKTRLESDPKLRMTSPPLPDSVMKPEGIDGNQQSWYWPGDIFMAGGNLFIINKLIVPDKTKQGMFGFEWRADNLCKVSNPTAVPLNWQWQTAKLPEKEKSVLLGTAAFSGDGFAYIYTALPAQAHGLNVHPAGVARLALDVLLKMDMAQFEYWDGSNWVKDIGASAVIFPDGAPEMTVTKLQGEPFLVATYMPPLTADICMRFAKKPEGPWSEPLKVFRCPEADITVLDHKNSVYSAKAHPELSREPDEIVVSYCSNPGEMKHYLSRPDLYYPRFITVKLKPN